MHTHTQTHTHTQSDGHRETYKAMGIGEITDLPKNVVLLLSFAMKHVIQVNEVDQLT